MARIAVEWQKAPSGGDDPARQLQQLRQWCADLWALRKGDQNAQWLRIEREKLDLELKKNEAEAAARQREIEALKNPKKGGVSREFLEWFNKEFHML